MKPPLNFTPSLLSVFNGQDHIAFREVFNVNKAFIFFLYKSLSNEAGTIHRNGSSLCPVCAEALSVDSIANGIGEQIVRVCECRDNQQEGNKEFFHCQLIGS
jgi:hypothetical protein